MARQRQTGRAILRVAHQERHLVLGQGREQRQREGALKAHRDHRGQVFEREVVLVTRAVVEDEAVLGEGELQPRLQQVEEVMPHSRVPPLSDGYATRSRSMASLR